MPQDSQNSKQKPQEMELDSESNAPQLSSLDSGLLALRNAKKFLKESFEKLLNLEQTNFALGIKYLQEGGYLDAIVRFKIVSWLNPANDIAQYLLGKTYVYAGKRDKAILPLKAALKAKPQLEEAKFFLACCGVGDEPERVPPSLHIEQLEKLAASYDDVQVQVENRKLHQIGFKMLSEHYGDKQGFDVLDLDIRTGASGESILPFANHIVGVEPCLQMLAQARNLRVNDRLVYNELITKLPLDQMKKEERQFDIVQAYFSLSCYGNLDEFFEQVQKKLRVNGCFLVAVESKNGEGYAFNAKKMCFNHSAEYVQKTAKRKGFELISRKEIVNQSGLTDIIFLLVYPS